MSLELPHQRLVVQVPHGDVAVAAAAEAHLRVGADGQGVAGGRARRQFGLDAGRRTGQVPNRQVAGLAAHYQRPSVRQKFHGSDVVVPLLKTHKTSFMPFSARDRLISESNYHFL